MDYSIIIIIVILVIILLIIKKVWSHTSEWDKHMKYMVVDLTNENKTLIENFNNTLDKYTENINNMCINNIQQLKHITALNTQPITKRTSCMYDETDASDFHSGFGMPYLSDIQAGADEEYYMSDYSKDKYIFKKSNNFKNKQSFNDNESSLSSKETLEEIENAFDDNLNKIDDLKSNISIADDNNIDNNDFNSEDSSLKSTSNISRNSVDSSLNSQLLSSDSNNTPSLESSENDKNIENNNEYADIENISQSNDEQNSAINQQPVFNFSDEHNNESSIDSDNSEINENNEHSIELSDKHSIENVNDIVNQQIDEPIFEKDEQIKSNSTRGKKSGISGKNNNSDKEISNPCINKQSDGKYILKDFKEYKLNELKQLSTQYNLSLVTFVNGKRKTFGKQQLFNNIKEYLLECQ